MNLNIGDLVKVKASFLGSKPNSVGFIYDTYSDFNGKGVGVCIILKDGNDLGGFSVDEQDEYLEYIGPSGIFYIFKNVIQLSIDYDKGYFKFN